MIVVSVRLQSRTGPFDLADCPEKPLTPLLRELDFPYPLSGIDDKRIWNTDFHLLFDKSAIGESLDQVIGMDLAARAGGLLEFFGSTGTVPSVVRTRQSGLPEMPRASERKGLPKEGRPGSSW